MYGPPQAPQVPQPSKSPASGGRIALLVLFSALALLSCGFLAWAPMLRLAIVTRRALDWVLFGATFLLSAGLFAYAAATGDQESTTTEALVAVGIMVVLVAGSITYSLVTEIRRLDRSVAAAPALRPPGYDPSAAVTVPSPIGNPNPYVGPVAAPPAVRAPQPPAAHGPRIDQVRAELDELSDLLRHQREDDGRA
ncbi:hypothetical protein GCM10010275_47070 [Streptomyces litmocidini]|uniref:hypothetical protein n=1 Tax=Streptomyces litmocidini TaxID=67318 RepID=UPI00167CEBED|nr:hypothetical protein [Streptomyces litmocidini]GGV02588.1 hypothetical protein GCM10010275_47070 [Streptomyces litmocidini]